MGSIVIFYWVMAILRLTLGSFVIAVLVGSFNAVREEIRVEATRTACFPEGYVSATSTPQPLPSLLELWWYVLSWRAYGGWAPLLQTKLQTLHDAILDEREEETAKDASLTSLDGGNRSHHVQSSPNLNTVCRATRTLSKRTHGSRRSTHARSARNYVTEGRHHPLEENGLVHALVVVTATRLRAHVGRHATLLLFRSFPLVRGAVVHGPMGERLVHRNANGKEANDVELSSWQSLLSACDAEVVDEEQGGVRKAEASGSSDARSPHSIIRHSIARMAKRGSRSIVGGRLGVQRATCCAPSVDFASGSSEAAGVASSSLV